MQRVAEGLSEEDAWRLFYQILDALVHMGSMGIVSQDSRLTCSRSHGKPASPRYQAHEHLHWCVIVFTFYCDILILHSDGKGDCKGESFDVLCRIGFHIITSRRLWSGYIEFSCC